jgi:hypothetical protein
MVEGMSYTGTESIESIESIDVVYRYGVVLHRLDVGSEPSMYQQSGKNCRNPKVPRVDVPLATGTRQTCFLGDYLLRLRSPFPSG